MKPKTDYLNAARYILSPAAFERYAKGDHFFGTAIRKTTDGLNGLYDPSDFFVSRWSKCRAGTEANISPPAPDKSQTQGQPDSR